MTKDKAVIAESKLEPTRKARQLDIIRLWKANKGVGTAQCVTGFGKTTIALLIIRRYRKGIGQETSKIIVVVPTLFLQEQWNDVIAYWGFKNIEVWTIQSLIKKKHECSLLIPDEIHMYTAEHFSKLFDCVRYKQILGLTATLRDGDEKSEVVHSKCPVIDTVSLKEAVDNNWVSEFMIYNLGILLTPEQAEEYKVYSADISKYFAPFNFDFKIAMKCLTNVHYRKFYANRLQWDMNKVFVYAKGWNEAISSRKDFLYNLPQKIDFAEEIVRHFSDKLIITFSQIIDPADALTSRLKGIALPYHSKVNTMEIVDLFGANESSKLTKKQIKLKTIERFKDPDDPIRVINTAKAMDMGVDIPDIDMGITLSGS